MGLRMTQHTKWQMWIFSKFNEESQTTLISSSLIIVELKVQIWMKCQTLALNGILFDKLITNCRYTNVQISKNQVHS